MIHLSWWYFNVAIYSFRPIVNAGKDKVIRNQKSRRVRDAVNEKLCAELFWNQDYLEVAPALTILLSHFTDSCTSDWLPLQMLENPAKMLSPLRVWLDPSSRDWVGLWYVYEFWLPSHRALITHLSLPLEHGPHWIPMEEVDIGVWQKDAKRQYKKRNMSFNVWIFFMLKM